MSHTFFGEALDCFARPAGSLAALGLLSLANCAPASVLTLTYQGPEAEHYVSARWIGAATSPASQSYHPGVHLNPPSDNCTPPTCWSWTLQEDRGFQDRMYALGRGFENGAAVNLDYLLASAPARTDAVRVEGGAAFITQGCRESASLDWELPETWPVNPQGRYVYLGAAEDCQMRPGYTLIVNDGTPDWLLHVIEDSLQQALPAYAAGLEQAPVTPLVLVFTDLDDGLNNVRQADLAWNDVIFFRYNGSAWTNFDERAAAYIAHQARHEVAHLWLGGRLRHAPGQARAFLFEGAADYLADLVDDPELAPLDVRLLETVTARYRACDSGLRHRALNARPAFGGRIDYDCGYVAMWLADLMAAQSGERVWSHWREWLERGEDVTADAFFEGLGKPAVRAWTDSVGSAARAASLKPALERLGVQMRSEPETRSGEIVWRMLSVLFEQHCAPDAPRGYYTREDHLQLDTGDNCGVLSGDAEITHLEGVSFVGDVSGLWAAVSTRCDQGEDLQFTTRSGETLPASCPDVLPPAPQLFVFDPMPLATEGEVFRDCAACPEMVVIPEGTFRMGSPASEPGRSDDEGPQHSVAISAYALAKTEVTVGEFRRFVEATAYRTDAERNADGNTGCFTHQGGTEFGWTSGMSWRDPGFSQSDRHPVVCVSWNDAQAYLNWLSDETGERYRLPSEAEQEYALRAGSISTYPWGSNVNAACTHGNILDQTVVRSTLSDFASLAISCTDQATFTAAVGSYQANRFGLYDMIGNAIEWGEDCWNESYRGTPSDGSTWMIGDCSLAMLRGGSWVNNGQYLRSADRYGYPRANRSSLIGFRLARSVAL